jgi:hypothetical protein
MKCTVPWKEQHVQCINTYFCFISSTFSVDCLFKFTPFLLVSLEKRPPGISSTEAVFGTTEGGGGGEVSRTNHTVLCWSRVYSVLPQSQQSPSISLYFFNIFPDFGRHKIRIPYPYYLVFRIYSIYERKKIAVYLPFSSNVLPTQCQ